MKSLIILCADTVGGYGFENEFGGKSAFYRTLEWTKKIAPDAGVTFFCTEENSAGIHRGIDEFLKGASSVESGENGTAFQFRVKAKNSWTNGIFFQELSDSCAETGADCVLFSYAFCPFLNEELTKKLIQTHETYKSEYTFADGFPVGVSPEIIDSGLCSILSGMIRTKDDLSEKPLSRTSVFDLIKTDINSFEIETEISEIDWRLYRLELCCDKKENFLACKNLYEAASDIVNCENADIQKIIGIAAKTRSVLKTVPAFFNIQIEEKCESENPFCAFTKYAKEKKSGMPFEKFKALVSEINRFNPNAVVGLSLWGEPLMHPDFFACAAEVLKYPNLSLFIESEGLGFAKNENDGTFDALVEKLTALSKTFGNLPVRENGFPALMWCIQIDAMSQNLYQTIHPGLNLSDAVESVKILNSIFPGNVYAQYTRLNQNECELENFYRTYKEKDSVSSGKFVIQKYDWLCGKMDDCKPCDLSPVERLPCWHLRRDFSILANGDVPLCKDLSFENSVGNVFSSSLEEIWKQTDSVLENHIEKKYCEGCACCDEYYTFYF